MQLMLDMEIPEPIPAKVIPFKPRPTGLICTWCRKGTMRVGAYPVPAGTGWKEGVNFHPDCRATMSRWGTG